MFNKKIKKRKWSFIGKFNKKVFPIKKVYIKGKKKNWIIIDTRTKFEYFEAHIYNSIHVPFYSIKKFITSQEKSKKIIIVSRKERTYSNILSWGKSIGYNKIYILKNGLNNYKQSEFLKCSSKK